jgi:hypothetical protein
MLPGSGQKCAQFDLSRHWVMSPQTLVVSAAPDVYLKSQQLNRLNRYKIIITQYMRII